MSPLKSDTNRIELLRGALLETIDFLWRRRASEIQAGFIEDYVRLDWLEWRGGGLHLTVLGENISQQESNLRHSRLCFD